MRRKRRENDEANESRFTPPIPEATGMKTIPFAERFTCTINEACKVTGLGRTKLYEIIGAGHVATTAIGRRRLVVVRSLLSFLESRVSTRPPAT
jgi:excisionase family DNA binding protein